MITEIEYSEPQPFRCVGGPWAGQAILLGDDGSTMVFTVKPARKQWRGRYTTRKPGDKKLPRECDDEGISRPVRSCRWENVPLGS